MRLRWPTRSAEISTKDVEAKAGTYRATASILGKTSDEVVLVLS